MLPQRRVGQGVALDRSALVQAVEVDLGLLLLAVDSRGARRVGGHVVHELAAASPAGLQILLERIRHERRGIGRLAEDPEVGEVHAALTGRLVEEVGAVPVPQLGRLPLDH
jgi:hypothetical protein